ncbi:hypothetical protein N579_0113240 [Corynebacterium pseudodiphtheriticum 090104]|nr:hypothetical protein N579_0113240 [Corynebacterium pseudodiphtheriticum 090104]
MTGLITVVMGPVLFCRMSWLFAGGMYRFLVVNEHGLSRKTSLVATYFQVGYFLTKLIGNGFQ